MICVEVITEFIADYVEGRLPAETRAEFDRHLEVCKSCTAYLQNYRATIAMAASAHHEPPPREVPQELVDAIFATLKIEPR